MRLISATRDMIPFTGLLSHPEAREFLELWGGGYYAILDDGEPFGIIAIKDHPDNAQYCWGNAWIVPARRGRWMTVEAVDLVKGFCLMRHSKLLAATDNLRCGRFLRKAGFNKYCQEGDVSYYSIIRESL